MREPVYTCEGPQNLPPWTCLIFDVQAEPRVDSILVDGPSSCEHCWGIYRTYLHDTPREFYDELQSVVKGYHIVHTFEGPYLHSRLCKTLAPHIVGRGKAESAHQALLLHTISSVA